MTASVTLPKLKNSRLKSFVQRFGHEYLNLACHAAFPLALTPELLYLLRENFQTQAPWIAVSDILLSLCDPVGYQLYELEPEVRNELLLILKERFGEERLYQLSDFMVLYIRQHLPSNDQIAQNLGAAPHWTALAYTRPEQAVQDIAQELKKALEKDNSEDWVYLTSVLESYGGLDPLLESGFKPLLTLARGWEAKARGDNETAAAEFANLGQSGKQVQVQGVSFTIPSPEHNYFSFEVVTVNRRGEILNRETKQAQYFRENLSDDVDLDMVSIPGGKFMMGSPEGEGIDSERPQHQVTIQPFFMGKYPVTQAQWRVVANLPKVNQNLEPDPAFFKGDNRPVEKVSWYDAIEFCDRLSNHTDKKYRLPSEAEWEYACRAGTTTPFHFGETITTELANYLVKDYEDFNLQGLYDQYQGKDDEDLDLRRFYDYSFQDLDRRKTTSVEHFGVANSYGLWDMHGNVWEWCLDPWHYNYENAPIDGSVWTEGGSSSKKILRSGSWLFDSRLCRSAFRIDNNPDDRYFNIGFRVVCEADSKED